MEYFGFIFFVIVIVMLVRNAMGGDSKGTSDRPSPTGKTRKDSWPEPRRSARRRSATRRPTSQQSGPRRATSEQTVSTVSEESPQRSRGGSEVPESLTDPELSDADLENATSRPESQTVQDVPAPHDGQVRSDRSPSPERSAPSDPLSVSDHPHVPPERPGVPSSSDTHDRPEAPGASPGSTVYTGASSFYTSTNVYTSSFSLTENTDGEPTGNTDGQPTGNAEEEPTGNEGSGSTTP